MSEMKEEKDLTKIGEFGLINILTSKIQLRHSSTKYGVGDDAAVFQYDDGKQAVVTTDLLTEGIHFDLTYTPLKHLGYKAVIVNLSDVYAMNAQPRQIVVAIAVSAKFTTQMIEELYEGIHLACDEYGVDLVGGDTTSSLTGLTISITAIGEGDTGKLTYRKGAKNTDIICVTGNLGAAYMGLQLLEREKRIFQETGQSQPDFAGYEYILERQLKPEAQKGLIDKLQEHNLTPTSMIDISDGLSSEVLHICKASGVGCNIYTEKIPIDTETVRLAEELEMEPITVALNGGEDYELLFTLPVAEYENVVKLGGVSIIGHITSEGEGAHLILPNGSAVEIRSMGWNSLKD